MNKIQMMVTLKKSFDDEGLGQSFYCESFTQEVGKVTLYTNDGVYFIHGNVVTDAFVCNGVGMKTPNKEALKYNREVLKEYELECHPQPDTLMQK